MTGFVIHVIAQTTSTLPNAAAGGQKVLSLQSLTAIGTATGGGAILTPIFNAIGQAIKQHPKVKNDWLRWLLPILSLIIGVAVLVLEIHFGYTVDPLTAFLFIGMFLVGAVGADAAYNLLKGTPVLPPGPDNHPADAANATNIIIPTPVTTAVSAAITQGNIPVAPTSTPQITTPPSPAPNLPPSPFSPRGH